MSLEDRGNAGTVEAAAGNRGEPGSLAAENELLRARYSRANSYIREKVNELLAVMGTAPLRTEELDDATLIDLDPVGIVCGSFRQILEHLNETNDKLRYANDEIQAIFESVGLGILVIDRSLKILACNSRLKEQFFPAASDPLGRFCHSLICTFDAPERSCPFLQIFRDPKPLHLTDWVIGGRHYDVVGTPMRNPSGAVSSVVVIYADVTDRIHADEALRRSEERYRDLFEGAHDLIMSVRRDGTLEYVNPAWCETLGYECGESAGLTIFDLLHKDCEDICRGKISAMLSEGRGGRLHTYLRSKSGVKIVVEGELNLVLEAGRPVGLRGILRNITEKEQLEEEIRKREKLESVGLLAGGIAHDFNNILTAVLGNISLAALRARPGEEIHTRLQEAERAVMSARELTQQLLTFAKGGLPVKRVATLVDLIRNQAAFALRGSAVACRYAIAPDLWAAEVDEGQIGQVINNLVLNAVQAMPRGGHLTIGASNAVIDPHDGLTPPAGNYVLVTVADEGCGISPESLQRIFDPYFTTKSGGNGLGLAIVHSIVTKHGGCIRVASEVGRGSTFSIYLPAAKTGAIKAQAAAPTTPTGRGRVLVMDDEEVVREVATHMLRELGYEVECARDGSDAVRRYREALEAGRGFAVVVMDLTIPGGMGGSEAVGQLLAIDPGVKAIVSSGYSSDPILAHHRDFGFCGVIAKPYKLSDLAAAVQSALHGGSR